MMSAASVLEDIATGVGIVGVAIILWGVVVALAATVRVELSTLRHRNMPKARIRLRQQLGSSLLLGLEFLIAADVIRSVIQPTLEEVAVLGGIVAIRTVISYSLHKEMESQAAPDGDEAR